MILMTRNNSLTHLRPRHFNMYLHYFVFKNCLLAQIIIIKAILQIIYCSMLGKFGLATTKVVVTPSSHTEVRAVTCLRRHITKQETYIIKNICHNLKEFIKLAILIKHNSISQVD